MRKGGRILYLLFSILTLPYIVGCENQGISIEEQNKELVLHINEEGINKQNLDIWDDVLTPNHVQHCQAMPPAFQEIHGIEAMKEFLGEHFADFPDWHEKIDLIIAEGDKVALITTGTGTQRRQIGSFPSTGKKVELVNFTVYRLENGKIAETWLIWDNLEMLRQLGHFPPIQKGIE